MRNRARVSRLFLPQQFSEVSTFCLIHKAVSRDYFYLCPGVITSRNWGGKIGPSFMYILPVYLKRLPQH